MFSDEISALALGEVAGGRLQEASEVLTYAIQSRAGLQGATERGPLAAPALDAWRGLMWALLVVSGELSLEEEPPAWLGLALLAPDARAGLIAEASARVLQALEGGERSSAGAAPAISEPLEGALYRAAHLALTLSPDPRAPLQGYSAPTARAPQGSLWPLKAQLTLLEDAEGARALLVAADIFGVDPRLLAEVRAAARHWGVEPEAVVINASHTHYGPATLAKVLPSLARLNEAYVDQLAGQITTSLPRLALSLAPARLSVARGALQLGFHRRVVDPQGAVQMTPNLAEGAYPTAALALRVERAGMRDLVWLQHACHPTALGAAPLLSSDLVGALRARLSGALDAEVGFLQGCAGDLKAGLVAGGAARWTQRPEEVEELCAAAARQLASSLTPWEPLAGPIRATRAEVTLPLTPAAPQRDPHAAAYRALYEEWRSPAARRLGFTEGALRVELSLLRLGALHVLCVPGEPVSEYTRLLSAAVSPEGGPVMTLGYTNGLAAYLPTERVLREGGYEGRYAHTVYLLEGPFAPGVEGLLVGAASALRARLDDPASQPASQPSSQPSSRPAAWPLRARAPARAFFVLSTGRSGTQTLAHLMRSAQNAKVWHHPEPNMIQETLHAYWGALDHRREFWRGRAHIVTQAWREGLIHGETDHNMTPFASAIADDVPEARFLVLIRDPREFIRSGMRRGYFVAGGPWDEGRLRPPPGAPLQARWAGMHPFEKVCWLWAETYRHILRHIEHIGRERVMVVRFEDLVRGPALSEEIFRFLSLDGFSRAEAEAVLGQKLNAQQGGQFPHPREWTAQLLDMSWAHCGEVAARFGYQREYGATLGQIDLG